MFTLVLKTAAKISLFSLRYHYPRFFLIFFCALRFHFNDEIKAGSTSLYFIHFLSSPEAIFPRSSERSEAHTARRAQRRDGCRQHADNELQHRLPSVLLHEV